MAKQTSNATANPAGTTQTPDGCVVPSQTGRLASCEHGRDVPDHLAARAGAAGHQRRGGPAVVVTCFICGQPATRRVIVSKVDGEALRYVCCDAHEPTHIPQGDIVVIHTYPLGDH